MKGYLVGKENKMYGYKKQVELSYEDTIQKTREALKEHGFGVLTEIDVKATLKKKLDINFDKYIILGACKPKMAFKALSVERDIGLMLPCNIIVYEQEEKVFISAILPSVAMGMIVNPELKEIATIVEKDLKDTIDSI